MSRLLLIRHGQSANNALPETNRVADPGLTEVGIKQASLLAEHFIESGITHLYCSPFLRSLETTRPVADLLRVPVYVRNNLFEQGGCYSGYGDSKRGEAGMGSTELSKHYPHWSIDQAIASSGWWGRPYETWEAAQTRAQDVVRWLREEIASCPGYHAMIIHADFKQLLVEALIAELPDGGTSETESPEVSLGAGLRSADIKNTGISEFKWLQGAWYPETLNRVPHLPTELVTR